MNSNTASMETKSEVEPDEDSKAGAMGLSGSTCASLDFQLSRIDPQLKIELDARAHCTLRPEQMVIRQELRDATLQCLAVRRVALKQQLLEDFMQEDRELRSLGIAYARPGPDT